MHNARMPIIPIVAAGLGSVTLAGLLLVAERRDAARDRWLFKASTSTLFVVAAIGRSPASGYDWLILVGLALSAVGDVALIPKGQRWFLAGLVAFFCAHVAYTTAFLQFARPETLNRTAAVVSLASGIGCLAYLRPHLGNMAVPVAAYVAVITIMLVAAWSMDPAVPLAASRRAMAGATLFYVSDLAIARDRFLPGTGFTNRAVGLALYFAGQFLLAFSINA